MFQTTGSSSMEESLSPAQRDQVLGLYAETLLTEFISKDAGIKTSINQKFDEVALEELEALVMADEEWGDEFVTKFVDKNVALYHGLRNTALEKIRQMDVVHGKVRNVAMPPSCSQSSRTKFASSRT